jgi:hypothetical protein
LPDGSGGEAGYGVTGTSSKVTTRLTVVDVVVGDGVAEDVAGADGELGGEAVGVLAVGVGVVM